MRHGSGGLDHKKRATGKSSKWVIHLFSRSFFVVTNHEIFVVSFWCGVDLDSHVRIFHGFPDWELSMEQVHAIRRQKLVPDGLLCLGWPKKKEPCEGGRVLKGYCENQGSPRSSTCVSLYIYIYIYGHPPPPMIHLQAFYMGITSVLCTFFFTRKMTFSCFYFFYLLRKSPTQTHTHTHAILFLFTFLSFLEVLVKNPKNIEKTKKNKKNKIARPM